MTKPAPTTGHRREGPILPPLLSSCSESLQGRGFVKYSKLDETWRTSPYWSHMRDGRWVSGKGRTVRGQALVLGFHPSGTNSPGDVGSVRGSLGSLGFCSLISPVRGEAWVPAYLEPFIQVALMHIRIENYPF